MTLIIATSSVKNKLFEKFQKPKNAGGMKNRHLSVRAGQLRACDSLGPSGCEILRQIGEGAAPVHGIRPSLLNTSKRRSSHHTTKAHSLLPSEKYAQSLSPLPEPRRAFARICGAAGPGRFG